MEKIYSVTAYFEDWESSSWIDIGLFGTRDEAEAVRDKWEGFFDAHSRNFPSDRDDAYYNAYSKLGEIREYKGIEIQERVFGVDLFSSLKEGRSEEMQGLVMEWERDYIIDKIINK